MINDTARTCIRSTLSLLGVLAMSACTTLEPSPASYESLSPQLDPGDRVMIYEKSGRIIDLRVVSVDEEEIRGSLTKNGLEAITVQLSEIERIELEKIAPVRTSLAVLGGIVAFPVVVVIMVLGHEDSHADAHSHSHVE